MGPSLNMPYPGGGAGSHAGPSTTRICSSSVAPIAIPTTGQPVTTMAVRPGGVTAVTSTAKQSTPDSTAARASRSAERTSGWHLGAASRPTRTSKVTGPSRSRTHPCLPSRCSHFGGDQPCDTPSMITSTPSTWRPARRPRIIGRQSGVEVRDVSVGAVDGGAESRKVLKTFALRGAPCGNWSDPTVSVYPDDEEHVAEGRETDKPDSILVGDRPVCIGQRVFIPINGSRFFKAHPVFAQVRPRLVLVPRLVHPRHRTERRLPATHAGLRCDLLARSAARRGRVDAAPTNPGIRTPNWAIRRELLAPRQRQVELAAETPRDSGICWRGANAYAAAATQRPNPRDTLGGTTARNDGPHMTHDAQGTRA
jgi:hypothetical protein